MVSDLHRQCDEVFSPSPWSTIAHVFRQAYPDASSTYYTNALRYLLKNRTKRGPITPGEVVEAAPRAARDRQYSAGVAQDKNRLFGHVYFCGEDDNGDPMEVKSYDLSRDISDGKDFYELETEVRNTNRHNKDGKYIIRVEHVA